VKHVIYVLASDLRKVGIGIIVLGVLAIMAVTLASILLFCEWLIQAGEIPTLTRHWAAIIYGGIVIVCTFVIAVSVWILSIFERSENNDRP